MGTQGKIFDIKKFAVHDGPGIRTTVFLKGCSLRCAWCHNPEGLSAQPEIMVFAGRCLPGCRACLAACPQVALRRSRSGIVLDRARCDGCGACIQACPAEALQATGRSVTVAQVMEEIIKDKPFYEESSGGVTFSGGEPMLQPKFLKELLRACRRQGMATAIDTAGHVPFASFAGLLPLTGLFLYDLKLIDPKRHQRLTGAGNRLILENLKKLSRAGAPLAIRIPLIPGVNDAPRDLQQAAAFCAALPHRHPVHLLPYHRVYVGKLARLGIAATLPAIRPPARAALNRAREIFARHDLTVCIGG
jgi:pyruvate formate lyase activating enzyme